MCHIRSTAGVFSVHGVVFCSHKRGGEGHSISHVGPHNLIHHLEVCNSLDREAVNASSVRTPYPRHQVDEQAAEAGALHFDHQGARGLFALYFDHQRVRHRSSPPCSGEREREGESERETGTHTHTQRERERETCRSAPVSRTRGFYCYLS